MEVNCLFWYFSFFYGNYSQNTVAQIGLFSLYFLFLLLQLTSHSGIDGEKQQKTVWKLFADDDDCWLSWPEQVLTQMTDSFSGGVERMSGVVADKNITVCKKSNYQKNNVCSKTSTKVQNYFNKYTCSKVLTIIWKKSFRNSSIFVGLS